MIVYNVTTKVEQSIAEEWLHWLKEEHIPDLVNTECFTYAVIFQLEEVDDLDGPTYAVQYHAANKELYNRYMNEHATEMRKKAISKWGDKFISIRTVMKAVH